MLDLLGGAVLLLLPLLSTSTETEDQVKGRLLLDVVVAEGAAVLKLLSSEDQALLVGRDTTSHHRRQHRPLHSQPSIVPLLVLDFGLDIVDGVRGLDLQGDGFTREAVEKTMRWARTGRSALDNVRFDENLHFFGRLRLSNEINGGVFDKSKSR